MNIKIKINRLCLILICAALLRGDSNNEKPQTHYLAPVNIIKKQNWFIDWDITSSDSIERLLMKKELKAPYGD